MFVGTHEKVLKADVEIPANHKRIIYLPIGTQHGRGLDNHSSLSIFFQTQTVMTDFLDEPFNNNKKSRGCDSDGRQTPMTNPSVSFRNRSFRAFSKSLITMFELVGRILLLIMRIEAPLMS